jgi:hypothetical protein
MGVRGRALRPGLGGWTPEKTRKSPVCILADRALPLCSGDRIRTCDLWVMSPASYRAAPPRVVVLLRTIRGVSGGFPPGGHIRADLRKGRFLALRRQGVRGKAPVGPGTGWPVGRRWSARTGVGVWSVPPRWSVGATVGSFRKSRYRTIRYAQFPVRRGLVGCRLFGVLVFCGWGCHLLHATPARAGELANDPRGLSTLVVHTGLPGLSTPSCW